MDLEYLKSDYLLELAKNAVITIGLAVLVYVEIILINRGANYLKKHVLSSGQYFLGDFSIQSLRVLSGQKKRSLLVGMIDLIRVSVILLDVYFTLILVVSLFPGTDNVVNNLLNLIFQPLENILIYFIDFLPNLFSIVIIVAVARYAVKVVKALRDEVAKGTFAIKGFHPEWARTTASIIIFVLNAFAFVMIFPYLPGSDSLAFKGVAAFVGAFVTLGGGSAISNYIAGIVLTYMHPFQEGDWVKINDTLGEIVEKGALAVKVRTTRKVLVTVPNNQVLSSQSINYSGNSPDHKTLLHPEVTIGYDVDWKVVHELLLNAARNTDGIDAADEPFVRQIGLEDFYVRYELNVYSKEVHRMYHIYSELNRNILDEFNRAGVEIMSPHYQAERDGSSITIPDRGTSPSADDKSSGSVPG